MKLVMCVHFGSEGATAIALAFDDWEAAEAGRSYFSQVATTAQTVPIVQTVQAVQAVPTLPTGPLAGVSKPARDEPDLRALSGLLQLLREHALQPEVIVIDGWVHLDAQAKPGLGQHLYQALGGRSAVIGISKTARPDLPAQFEVYRDEEAAPLVVTCAGIDLGAAKARVRAMHGKRRVPTLLKLAARMAKADKASG